MSKIFKVVCDVTDIDWEIDDEGDFDDYGLPTEIIGLTLEHTLEDITDEEIADIVSDKISDMYGFLHNGFNIENIRKLS